MGLRPWDLPVGSPFSHPLALGGWGPPDPFWGASEALHPQPCCRTPAWRKVAPPGLQGRSAQAGASMGVMCFLPGQRGGLSWCAPWEGQAYMTGDRGLFDCWLH